MRTDVLLSVTGLGVSYRSGSELQSALNHVDVTVTRHRLTAIIGESGSGKSTLAHAIVRLLPDNARVTAGSVTFEGRNLLGLSARAVRSVRGQRIGFIPQDPVASLNPTATIGSQIREAYRLGGSKLSPVEVAEQINDDLRAVGFEDPSNLLPSYPHELSGGQRQRVLVAIAFSQRPPLVIADEPTSALDALVAKDVLTSIDRIRADHRTTVVMITHDLALAAARADDVVVMQSGVAVESGPVDEVFRRPQHPYTRELLASSRRLDGRRVRPIIELLTDRPPVAPTDGIEPTSDAVVLSGLSKTFALRDGSRLQAVADLSLTVRAGTTFALVGESGSGKTTTSRMLLGLTRPDSGTATVLGHDIWDLPRTQLRQLRRDLQPVFQNPFTSLNPRLSVAAIIAEPLRVFGIGSRGERRERVVELLDLVRIPASYLARRPTELSGGQRQRLAIARALALDPKILILDEPVSALDAAIQSQILELLQSIQRRLGLTYLLVTHDLAVVVDFAQDIGVMQQGRLVEQGSVQQVVADPQHDYARALLAI